jgi:general secretion pathway protein D
LVAVLTSLRKCPAVRAASRVIYLSIVSATLCSCNLYTAERDEARPQDVLDKVRAMDLLPRFSPEGQVPNQPQGPRATVYEGQVVDAAAEVQQAGSGDGYELNFENTPITTVAKVILGDILGVGYTIDPRVQGTISLASGRPVPKSDVLFVLESALRMGNVALIRDTAGYRLVPTAEAVGSGNLDRAATNRQVEPGYGISVIRLQYVSAATLMKILDSFATKPGTVRADPARNLLIIQGSGPERRAALDTVLSFDVDWMRGQSVGIYPVRSSTPEPLIAELEKIIDSGEGGMSQNMVKLQPVGRLNAIMVVTRKTELLRMVSTWISRLDTADTTTTGVKVYRVRYGEARQMARLLNEMFAGGSGGATLDSAANQIAPGSGMITSSSGSPSSISRPALSNAPQQPGGAAAAGAAAAGGEAGLGGAKSDTSFGARSAGSGGSPVLPGVRITADVVNNNLLIFANQESYRIIERTLRQLDRPQLQVAIEATIAEVTLNDTLNYGVQFFLKSSDVGLGRDKGSIINTTGGAILGRAFPGFNFLIGSAAEPRLILDALHKVSDVKVLSNPSVVVLDNQVATLQVGDQIPVTTGTATVLNSSNQVVNTIDYRNTGIILRVVPRVNFNGNVVLDIEQEISNVANSDPTLTPTVSQRKVKSSIAVASGQTVLLAGLISERRDKGRQGLPIFEQIPKVGDLFGHQAGTAQRIELIMFIRPQVIRDSVDAHYVAEELRSKLGGQRTTVAPGTPVPPIGIPKQR